MDTTQIDYALISLLSRITRQTLSPRDAKPSVVFLTALLSLLIGVAMADGTVEATEKAKLKKLLGRLLPQGSPMKELARSIAKGIQREQVYQKSDDFQALIAPLSASERLLLLALGYEMAAVDGSANWVEISYLSLVGGWLRIGNPQQSVLAAVFAGQSEADSALKVQVEYLLRPE
ncbi:MAG: TerB family tellurite resistance protein [Spirulinaceae cyanobacterium RM2_2_10]|nr:TerB family tellurite resistance protein [Spirulinaceae cyanobacterium SM2_1_0]NJO18901.1 TerB family tellurite resistance protein [Spirulinaceae cyanobacterium RM2_2_10]